MRAEDREKVREALEWCLHVMAGVGKSGEAPSIEEGLAAQRAGRAALALLGPGYAALAGHSATGSGPTGSMALLSEEGGGPELLDFETALREWARSAGDREEGARRWAILGEARHVAQKHAGFSPAPEGPEPEGDEDGPICKKHGERLGCARCSEERLRDALRASPSLMRTRIGPGEPPPSPEGCPTCGGSGKRRFMAESCDTNITKAYEVPCPDCSAPAVGDDPECEAEDGGFFCTLKAGHAGEHKAHGTGPGVYHRWTDAPAPKESAREWAERHGHRLPSKEEQRIALDSEIGQGAGLPAPQDPWDLKPCPLCGGKAVVMGDDPGERQTVVCLGCGIGFDRLGAACPIEKQVEHWNRPRPVEGPDYAQPEAVQDALERIDALNTVKAERDAARCGERSADAEVERLRDKLQQAEAERDAARAELKALKARERECIEAFEPWVQGPGVVGGILHLQEQLAALRSAPPSEEQEALAREIEEDWDGTRIGEWSNAFHRRQPVTNQMSELAARVRALRLGVTEEERLAQAADRKQLRAIAGSCSAMGLQASADWLRSLAQRLSGEEAPRG